MRVETDPMLDAIRLGLQISRQQADEMACVYLYHLLMVLLTVSILVLTFYWQEIRRLPSSPDGRAEDERRTR